MAEATLYVENLFNDDLFTIPATAAGLQAVKARNGLLLWLAVPGDVFVLSSEPGDAFSRHIAALTGVGRDEVTILVPPPGRLGTDLLTRDRLADPAFLAHLALIAERRCATLKAYYQDRFIVTAFAERIGLAHSIPGRPFIAEGGADLLNSKSFFRALAAGSGLPIAQGGTTRGPAEAADAVCGQMRAGASAILKRDFHAGGFGNFLFSANPNIRPIGVRELIVVKEPGDVLDYLIANWPFLSGDGRFPLIVEHYHEGSVTLSAEIGIDVGGVRTDCLFEMRMTPRISGFRWLDPEDNAAPAAGFRRLAGRLAWLVHALGYRGMISVDGIRTPQGQTLLTEFNGRFSGITHLHGLLERLAGPGYAANRHVAAGLLRADSFEDALAKLAAAGIAFDRRAREGVILTADGSEAPRSFAYCAVARSAAGLKEMEAAARQQPRERYRTRGGHERCG